MYSSFDIFAPQVPYKLDVQNNTSLAMKGIKVAVEQVGTYVKAVDSAYLSVANFV